jgi:hypothetical protein
MAHLTIFGLSAQDSNRVHKLLWRRCLWGVGMEYDVDADILMTTTPSAADIVWGILQELNLLPDQTATFNLATESKGERQ